MSTTDTSTPTLDEIRKRRLEILQWEAENRNWNNRATRNGFCCYGATETSPGCAIGRLLSKDLQDKLSLDEQTGKAGPVNLIFSQLPKELQELGLNFLTALQQFHDRAQNFSNAGLSGIGQTNIKSLIKTYT